jgi:copper oxidase (laccase) domain-containing protein
VLVFDEVKKVIAVAHSGREGTRQKIVEKVIKIMTDKFGADVKDIKIEIGAGICKQHYEVSPEIAKEFYKECGVWNVECGVPHPLSPPSQRELKGSHLDLKQAIIDTALANGIAKNNISACPECTYESENYFSFRRDKNDKRQISLIGMVYV